MWPLQCGCSMRRAVQNKYFRLTAVVLTIASLATPVFLTTPTSAAVVQVFSSAQLTQGPYSLETFDDLSFVPGVTITGTSPLAIADSTSAPYYPSGNTGLMLTELPTEFLGANFNISFASPASSVGMFFGNDDTCCSIGFSANLDLFTSSGYLTTISVAANMNDGVDQFIGFNSDQLISSVSLRYGTGFDVALFPVIDDLYFNVAGESTVPLPAALPLFASGLGVLELLGWRKKKKARALAA